MNRIRFPLTPTMQSLAVGDLQDGLRILVSKEALPVPAPQRTVLLQRLRGERENVSYGEVTAMLVRAFQQTHDLPLTGAIDEATAKALNKQLSRLGAFEGEPLPDLRTVTGRVRRRDGTPAGDVVVQVSRIQPDGTHPVGSAATRGDGRYEIKYTALQPVDLQITGIGRDGRALGTPVLRPAAGTNEVVDLQLPDVEPTAYRVTGYVLSRSGVPLSGLRILIVDKGVGTPHELFATSTDDQGRYDATFADSDVRRRGKAQPDIEVRVYGSHGLLAASETRYDATTSETIDIVIDEYLGRARSEYETLLAAIGKHYSGRLADLREAGDRSDVTYLANKVGWDARAVALAALAEQFAAKTGEAGQQIPAALYYALFRAGVPATEAAVYRMDKESVQAIWQAAADDAVIPAGLTEAIPAASTQFQKVAFDRVFELPPVAGVSSLRDLAKVSVGDDAQRQKKLAQIYARHPDDSAKFWESVRAELGEPVEKRLRLDGRLAYLTLGNAPLMARLHAASGGGGLQDVRKLVDLGFYRAEKWDAVIGTDPLPGEVPGADGEKRKRYAEIMAAQIRLSFPTAVAAAMVRDGTTALAKPAARNAVQDFLTRHEDEFHIGRHPVEQFVRSRQLDAGDDVLREVKRLQRVYQITPSNEAMNTLLGSGVDSAHMVVRMGEQRFVKEFQQTLGGESTARLIYSRAEQIHASVLNVAMSFLTAGVAPAVGVHSPPQFVSPAPAGPNPNAGDVIAYSTLESLFGAMDYCACDHCRSVLSPAAYLVDLLLFCDQAAAAPYENPLVVLLQRRPDIEHLPLTCENTNTPQPYIDLVNEVLEYYVTRNLSLGGYQGHSTDGSVSADELMANPQHVTDGAYELLAGRPLVPGGSEPVLPAWSLLPFHRPLEKLRRYVAKLGLTLAELMESLRRNDAIERAADSEYGWRDILMEELLLSRAEYRLLTDRSVSLAKLYGYPAVTADADVVAKLSNAREFTRQTGISYEDLIDLLRTRFVNPHSTLLPRLERLGLSFSTLKAFKEGTLTDAQFEALVARPLDLSMYGGNVKNWVKDPANYANIMSLITLTKPGGSDDLCGFDELEFRYVRSDASALPPWEFVRMLRFIRIWKKLGWTIDQTDRALTALYPASEQPGGADNATALQKLDAGFRRLLPRLGFTRRAMDRLELNPGTDLQSLLACFASIDTHGPRSLYTEMFLNGGAAVADPAFRDNGYGGYLTGQANLAAHQQTLRAAFQITDAELAEISAKLGFDANTKLNLENITAIFRRAWLARKLKLSVRELLFLLERTGIDPFGQPDPPAPGLLRLVHLVSRIRATALKPAQVIYLFWDDDLSGKSAPSSAAVLGFAAELRAALQALEAEYTAGDDPDGKGARILMAKVYSSHTTDRFFGILEGSTVSDVSYAQDAAELPGAVTAVHPALTYDHFRKRLLYGAGAMSVSTRNTLRAVAGVTDAFRTAVDALFDKTRQIFEEHPDLLPLYEVYSDSSEPVDKKRAALVAEIVRKLLPRRKREQVLQSAAAVGRVDLSFAAELLENAAVLHAADDNTRPASDDLSAIEKGGLTAVFYRADGFPADPTMPPDEKKPAESLEYGPRNPLPQNGGNPISGVWSGYVQPPENGFFNVRIDADAGAEVTLALGGIAVTLAPSGTTWSNTSPIEFRAGATQSIRIAARKLKTRFSVRWETIGRGNEVIPAAFLYPDGAVERISGVYSRFLKAASLATALRLTAAEVAHLATLPALRIGSDGWLNRIPAGRAPADDVAIGLWRALEAVLDFVQLKRGLGASGGELVTILRDPSTAVTDPDSSLWSLSRWEASSFRLVLNRFGKTAADLADLATFRRVIEALQLVEKTAISAATLEKASTNEPTSEIVADVVSAVRARYDRAEWLKIAGAINDELRALQRDALVAYILQQMRTTSPHIDTPEKLFEYFLMDVQMEPCTMTSRVRHALSTVQLFIERCLMNLERRVDPASLKAVQWQWMSRYRVWEANRKVFLHPENWLEPEVRHDQSPFFKEALSELLQSDINEDTAAVAFLNYLTKLDEVAKLEPCGIHYESYQTPSEADDISHVVARTAGASRRYYYRRREYGYWTPWEQIRADIEDNPVVPVVWKGRLFVFWLRILKDGGASVPPPPATGSGGSGPAKVGDVAKVDFAAAITQPTVTVRAVLCWSEYYNGRWQPSRTSDVERPERLGEYATSGSGVFDRTLLSLAPQQEGTALRIFIRGGATDASFFLYNSHGSPLRQVEAPPSFSYALTRTRSINPAAGSLAISYWDQYLGAAGTLRRTVFTTPWNIVTPRIVEPLTFQPHPWEAPFFYDDRRHVFFVRTSHTPITIKEYRRYFPPPRIEGIRTFVPVVVIPPIARADLPAPIDSNRPRPDLGNVGVGQTMLPGNAGLPRVTLGTAGTVHFDGREIGIGGRLRR